MLSDKNISTKQIALIISAILFLGVLLFFLFTHHSYWYVISSAGLLAVLGYVVTYYFLEQFVQRKVKLIYKFISETKATKREEFYNKEILPQKTIDEMEKEVEVWSEERNKKIESLESNEKFRKEFLLHLTHELKTPIFASQNYIETLQDGALYDEQVNREFLDKASRNIQRLVLLVEDLDEIAKYESNEIQFKPQRFIIQELILETFEELKIAADQKEIRLMIKLGCEKGIEVFADRNRFKQVLTNLIENSIKYGRPHGETLAGVYAVDGDHVLVEISDNGLGIAEEHVPRVFERFFRTDAARSRKVGGTGLGLAIVKHIVEASGGQVYCRSKLDVGTTFGFTLSRK